MYNLRAHIEKVEELLEVNNSSSLTYAALECRIALEGVCYDRLRLAHDYIPHEEIKRWQPKDVINKLLKDVEPHIASSFTFSISKNPLQDSSETFSTNEMDNIEFVPVGTQVGFDANYIGKLWNALSSFLHVKLPRTTSDYVSAYSEPDVVRKKVSEALLEIKRLAAGNLTAVGFGGVVSFTCNCGVENKRRTDFMKNGQIISCVSSICTERWDVNVHNDNIDFHRRSVDLECKKCNQKTNFPEKTFLDLPRGQSASFVCEKCLDKNTFVWRLYREG